MDCLGVYRESRMTLLRCVCLAFACAVAASEAADIAYPARPVRVVVSNAPGSTPDILARILSAKLAAQTGQPFIVDTRSGASGIIGVELVKTAAPDGYTMLLGAT